MTRFKPIRWQLTESEYWKPLLFEQANMPDATVFIDNNDNNEDDRVNIRPLFSNKTAS